MRNESILFLRKDKHPTKVLVFWEDFEPDIPIRPRDYSFEEVLTALQLYEIRKQHLRNYPCTDCPHGWSDVKITSNGGMAIQSCKDHCSKYKRFRKRLTNKL